MATVAKYAARRDELERAGKAYAEPFFADYLYIKKPKELDRG